MSADTSKDFSLIQDEDVLKKMWQETEDFGRKKEIRSHMYKLREQRLKEFYNSNESTEIHRTTTGKTCDSRTHAGSLTDQSFLSLKSKEVRDSESPTRDSGYRIAGKHSDHGWDVLSANEISMDGKTHTTIKQATTAGTQKIDSGKIDFAGKTEQVSTVFQDGDDKNFTKSVGAKSNTMITQEAVGGDENSSFKATSTKVSSSSKVVTEHRTTDGKTLPLTTGDQVVRKIYTTDVPSDLKNHPSYLEGKTKVTQEIKTLPDGTTVTATRYETKGGTASQSHTTSKYSATSKSSSEQSSSFKTSQVELGGTTIVKDHHGVDEVDIICEPKTSMQIVRSSDQKHLDTDHSQKVRHEYHESQTVQEHRSSTQARKELHEKHVGQQQLQQQRIQEAVKKATSESMHQRKESVQHKSHTEFRQKQTNEKLRATDTEQVMVDMVPIDHIEVTRVTKTMPSEHVTHITTATHDTKGTTDMKSSTGVDVTSTRSTIYHHDTTRDKKLTNEQFITTERQHEIDTRKHVEPGPEYPKGKQPPNEKPQYEQPEKLQPIQPAKSEWEQPSKAEGQYDTTYRTDYVNRKISVEVSPTHDAFARSLRAVSPDRLPPHLVSPTHIKSASSTSLRGSNSRDKCRHPSRGSPERKSRSGSPRKSVDRFSSTETITYGSRASPEKKTPTKYVNGVDIVRKHDDRSTYESDTTTRKKKISTDTITRKTKPRSRSPSPISTVASEIEYFKNVNEIVTDLDEVTDETDTRRTTTTTERPSSLEIITTRKIKKVTERSPTSPLKDVSPTKASPPRASSPQKTRTLPEDRAMKRTDTYEERCRQILGITETNERRRSSLEKASIRKSSFTKDSTLSPNELPRKKSGETPRKSPTKDKPFRPTDFVTQLRKSPEKQVKTKSPSPTKEVPSQTRRSPEKKKNRPSTESPTKLQEFPSQIRRSPERKAFEPYPERRSPCKESPSKLSEFPSQIRQSPERQPLEPYPEKKRPCEKSHSSLQEFPSQIRKSPERQPLEPCPEKKGPFEKSPSNLQEFPSQIRKSPEKQHLETYPGRKSPTKDTPSKLSEFLPQIRKSPEREPYPEKKKLYEDIPSYIKEFPSQTRKSPVKEPLEPYPEKKRPCEDAPPKLKEFPSQIRKSPEREALEPYPERKSPTKDTPSKLSEFPSQIRKSPEKQPLEQYPEKKRACKDSPPQLEEFPSQIRRSPERHSLEPLSEKRKPRDDSPSKLSEFPSQSREGSCSLSSIPSAKSPETFKSNKNGKKPKSKKPTDTGSSSSSSEDEEVTEEVTKITTTTYENVVPVKEPEVTKKFISQLCREDEVKHTDSVKKATEELLEQEILQNRVEAHKTVKKDLSRSEKQMPVKPKTEVFIDIERQTAVQFAMKKKNDKAKDTKKETTTRTVKETPKSKKQPEIHRTEKSKFVGETEYTDEYCKTRPKVQKTTDKITLTDLERSQKNQIDSKVHTRTHRSDNTSSKKTTTNIFTNGDVCKRMKPKETTKSPTSTKTITTTIDVTSKKTPSPRTEDVKQSNVTTQSRYSTTVKKIINVPDQAVKPKPVEPKKLSPIKKVIDITKVKPYRTEQTTVNKHAVSSISVTTKPKTVTTKTTKTTTIKENISKPTRFHNGHIPSDTDEDIDSVEESTFNLTKSDAEKSFTSTRITKTRDDQDVTTRTSRKPDKCITTKTLIINNKDDKREVIVDLQRSKSSREPTPDRLCPVPLSSDDESGVPRYPDEVEEPEDGSLRRKPKPTRLSDVPIIESEDTVEFSRFTEVTDARKITEVDKVDQTDESLLSVNRKIHKFLDTAEKLTKEPLKVSGPAPKVERPKLEVNDDLESDECLLSVSDKVSKFITTAEQLITPKSMPERPKSPRCQNNIDDTRRHPKHSSDTTVEIEETIKDDECLLSVSEKASRFISTADKLATSDSKKQTVSLAKIDVNPGRKSPERKVPDRKSPERKSPIRPTDTQCVQIETEEQMYTRRPSPSRSSPSPDDKTPTRRPSNQYKEILKTGMSTTRRSSSPKQHESTPKSTKEEPKPVLSPTGRLRSTESIKRAKALFENIGKEKESAWSKDIISRPSVLEARKSKGEDRRDSLKKKLSYSEEEAPHEETCSRLERARSKSPEKERPRSKSPQKDHPSEVVQTQDQGDVPHYMLPLDRSLRPNSPHRESLAQNVPQSHQEKPIEEPEPHTTKFNVTLRRTDSGRAVKSSTTERRKSSLSSEKRITEEEIEEIFELEVLEELLEKVIGYDLRRKIRTQIRLVKKLISENSLESYIAKRKESIRRDSISKIIKTDHLRKASPERRTVDSTKSYHHTSITDSKDHSQSQSEYKLSYSYQARKSSSEYNTKTTSRSQSPEVKPVRAPSPQKQTRSRCSPEKEPRSRISPDRKTKSETKTFTNLKKSASMSKPVEDDKPEWVKSRNLRKTTETPAPIVKKTTTTTRTTKKETVRSKSPVKEVKTTDLITSSYGVGPTDENGTPLFGLRALRAQNKSDITKVQGTVVTSEYYSQNGEEPVGQICVTKYSTDPRDLGKADQTSTNKGLTSVTTTQKFGYKDTPSLKSLTSKKKEVTSTEESKTCTKSNKIARRNSVKEISQKFIDNAVDILKSERQTTYPKAGLILRTSSFKDSRTGDSRQARQTSPEKEDFESSVTVRTTKSRTEGGETTFLTNKSRVTGVQDVIDRMKTEEYREGDSAEDFEARSLLNKFIGSQVILSGMESRSTSSSTSTKCASTSVPSGGVKKTSKITITVTEGGKPVTKTLVFQHPITEEDLENIWDEQTLRLLLEQSLGYEERRAIRARLRQVMAEQEACADLVEKASLSQGPEQHHKSEQSPSSAPIDGESLLLPLLQGLLDAPDKEQLADSGTESGEDQRSGLLAEVQTALEKLSFSLRDDSNDISPERRASLLQLVTKLQAGLATTTPKLERRLSSGPSRFKGRRGRQNRHTVGVSSEELADARKLMEQISLHELTPSNSENKLIKYLQKQNSESSVTSTSSFSKLGSKGPVKNATAKPFNISSNSISNASSVPQTPTDPSGHFEAAFGEKSRYHETAPAHVNDRTSSCVVESDSSELLEDVEGIRTAHKAVQQAPARKKGASESAAESEEDDNTVKGLTVESANLDHAPSPQQVNPIYSRPLENFERARSPSYEEKVSRFNTMSKKNKMKRANTIDIPKALLIYTDEDDSEFSEDEEQRRKNNYYALRGPIRVHDPLNKNPLPVLQPKTESDQKFLAFINKNNSNVENKTTPWVHTNKTSMWGNRFGNIKNKYEKETDSVPENAAKNFWKSQDDHVISNSQVHGPKISRKSARNLQQMYEEKQRKKQENVAPHNQHVVKGSLTLKAEPERNYKLVPQPVPFNKFSHAPQSAFVALPQKNPTTPELATKEVIKTELIDARNDQLYLYSPKPMQPQSQNSSAATSPIITSKPWVANAVEHGGRVLSMAAKKFETPPQQDNFPVKPRKLSKEISRGFAPQQTPPEKMTAPYIVKSTDQKNSTVRKLSDQYDNMGNKIEDQKQPKTHYVPPHRVPQSMDQNIQYTTKVTQSFIPNVPDPQNYYEPRSKDSVRRTQSEKYQPFNVSEYTPVNYSITYDQPKPQPVQNYTKVEPKHQSMQNYGKVESRTQSMHNYSKVKPKTQSNQNYGKVEPRSQHMHNYNKVEPKPQTMYNYNKVEPQPMQVFQHVPGKDDTQEQQYTSSFQFNISSKNPNQVPVQVIEPVVQPKRLEKQLSTESIHEYNAISSKVMKGPVSQQAVTVRQKSPMNRDQHDIAAAFQLKSALQKVGKSEMSPPNKSPRSSVQYQPQSKPLVSPTNSFKYTALVANSQPPNSFKPNTDMTRDVQSRYKADDQKGFSKFYDPNEAPKPTVPVKSIKSKFEENSKTFGVVKPMQQQKPLGPIYNNVANSKPQPLIVNNNSQGVVTSKFHIPVINVAPSSPGIKVPTQAQMLSKSDSWHQICMANQVDGTPRSCSARAIVKSKSSHNLAVPKGQFEAGITREELQQKKKTIEAYFFGSKSPEPHEKNVKRSINRIKTSEKRSAYRQTTGVVRSKTLPDIVCPDLLDESNIDAAFEDLVKSTV